MVDFDVPKGVKYIRYSFLASIAPATFVLVLGLLFTIFTEPDYQSIEIDSKGFLCLCSVAYGLLFWLPLTLIALEGLKKLKKMDIIETIHFTSYGMVYDGIVMAVFMLIAWDNAYYLLLILFIPNFIHLGFSIFILYVIRNTPFRLEDLPPEPYPPLRPPSGTELP